MFHFSYVLSPCIWWDMDGTINSIDKYETAPILRVDDHVSKSYSDVFGNPASISDLTSMT